MAVNPKKLNKELAHLRFRKMNGKVLITNDVGRYAWLGQEDFDRLLSGDLDPGSELHEELARKEFLRGSNYTGRVVDIYRWRNEFLSDGPNLHIMILTLRCNHTCLYCHASRVPMDTDGHDMSIDTARSVVDLIFESTAGAINIEFQGGEPLANWDALRFVVEYATEKNREAGKDLAFTLVSNLSLMDEDKMKFLIDNQVYVCTSIDGPKELHEKNRVFTGGSSYDLAVEWIRRFNAEYEKRGYDPTVFHIDALMTTTRFSLPYWKEIVDEYLKLGLMSVHLRPLNPFGFVTNTWKTIGYSMEEFIDFYKKCFDYIVDLNLKGVQVIDRMSAIYLTRILTDRDPNYMELRSPCGAGIGQLAYNYDGQVFTCDEGRMMAQMGDDNFKMGHVDADNYVELMESEPVRTLVLASIQDGIPLCSTCSYKPYCGVCPIYNYVTQGDLFGQMPTNGRCQLALASFDHLFSYLMKEDREIDTIFQRWITVKTRQIDACDPY